MKKLFCALLSILMMVNTLIVPICVNADTGINYKNAQSLNEKSFYQSHFEHEMYPHTYKFIAERDNYYSFTIENESIEYRVPVYTDYLANMSMSIANSFHGKVQVEIYNSREKLLGSGYVRCGYKGSISLKLNAGETYYIVTKAVITVNGNYSIGVKEIPDFGADTWKEAENIGIGQLISSIDTGDDIDWYHFETDSTNSIYNFDIENISCKSNIYFNLYEYVEGAGENPLRNIIKNDYTNPGSKSKLDVRLNPDTKYYYCVEGAYDSTGGYQVDITQNVDAIGDSMSTAYSDYQVGQKLVSSIDGSNDYDYIEFTTDSDNAYYYLTFSSLSGRSILVDIINSSNGSVLSAKADLGKSLTKNIRLNGDSKYFLKVRDSYTYTGDYEIELKKKADVHKDTLDEATKISVNKLYKSSIDGEEDSDCFKFTTSKEGYYVITNNWYYNDYLTLTLYDEEKNEVSSKRSYDSPITIAEKLPANETYYVRVSIDRYSNETGNYDLKITYTADDASDEIENAKSFKTNTAVTGCVQSNLDQDWYKITLTNSQEYRISVTSENGELVYLDICNAYGKSLDHFSTSDKNSYNKTLSSGTYYIKMSTSTYKPADFKGYYTFAIYTCGSNHKYGSPVVIKKADFNNDGSYKKTCTICNEVSTTTTCWHIRNVTVSNGALTYTGKKLVPTVKVVDSYNNKISSSNYTVEYYNSAGKKIDSPTSVGKYTVKVIFKNLYSGSKKLSYVINPKGTKISKLTPAKGAITVKWSKQSTQTSGYQIMYSKNSGMYDAKTVTVSGASNTSKKLSGLAKKTKYYVKVRTYKTINGKKYYSSWSGYKSVKTK